MDSTLRLKNPEILVKGTADLAASGRVRLALIAGLAILALALRLFDLQAGSLWFDTAHSVALADSKNITEVFSGAAKDFQAPFYFVLLHFWIKLGYSDLWVKLFSVLCGVGVVVMTFVTAESMFSRRAAFLSALLTALSSYQIYYSRYPRAYILMAMLVLISIWSLYGALRGGRVRSWAIYTLVTVLGLYTHAYYLFIVISQGLFLLTYLLLNRRSETRALLPWGASQLIAFLAFAPWIGITWVQWLRVQQGADSWIPPVSLESIQQVYFWLWHRTKEDYPFLVSIPLWAGVYGMTAALLLSLFSRDKGRERWMLWCMVISPALLAFSISLISSPIWQPRYLVYISAPFYILVAQAIINLKDRIPVLGRPTAAFNIAVLGMILAVSLPPLDTLYNNPSYRTPELKESFSWLQNLYQHGDVIMHLHYQSYLPYLWYSQVFGQEEQAATHDIPCVWDSLPDHWCAQQPYRQSLLSQETKGVAPLQLGAARIWLVGLYEHRRDGEEKKVEDAVDELVRGLYQRCSVQKFMGVNVYELKASCS